MNLNELRLGMNVLVRYKEEQVLAKITEMGTDESLIKSIGNLEYELRVQFNGGKYFLCDADAVIRIVDPDEKFFVASQLNKIGARTFTGSGKTRHLFVDTLEEAISQTEAWVKEKHADAVFTWSDEPNYRFADERATCSAVIDAEETIDPGWANDWIDVRVTVEDQEHILSR